MSRTCDRCGEEMRPIDKETRIFSASYEPLNEESNPGDWATLSLCEDCQRDLRMEFYKRGIILHSTD